MLVFNIKTLSHFEFSIILGCDATSHCRRI